MSPADRCEEGKRTLVLLWFDFRLLSDDVGKVWQKNVFKGEWDDKTDGGCCNFASWTRNPQYWLVVSQVGCRLFFLFCLF